jgi:nuclear pore complex protein Nup205
MAFLKSMSRTHHLSILGNRFSAEEQSLKDLNQILRSSWTEERLQSICILGWACFLETLTNELSNQSQLRNFLVGELQALKRSWTEKYCYRDTTYAFLNATLKNWKKTYSIGSDAVDDPVGEEILTLLTSTFEVLIKRFVQFFKKNFRVMLSKDQDTSSAWDEKQKQGKSQSVSPQVKGTLCTAWETLLEFIYEIYVGREDQAVSWWTETDLAQFIRLSADVWTPKFLILFIRVLSALSTGIQCANHAHNVLNMEHSGSLGQVTWSTFFRTLGSYVERLGQSETTVELSPPEISLIVAFLELLRQVVTYSYTARRVLCENQDFRALDTLFYLLITRIPIELKSALLHSLAAFCAPPFASVDIANHIWSFLEQSQMVPINLELFQDDNVARSRKLDPQTLNRGLMFDIREIEANLHTYPETIAFLTLLKNLILSSEAKGPQSIFEGLGVPNRPGGIRVYISFVIDEVFLRIPERQFLDPTEKEIVTHLCLEIMLLCLERFDMTPALGSLVEQKPLSPNSMITTGGNVSPLRLLGLHPGFEILSRLLAGSKLTHEILNLALQSNPKISLTVLKLVNQSLRQHKTFLEIISPAMVEAKIANGLLLPSSMSGIDSLLASRNDVVLQLAFNVNSDSEMVCLLSLQIIFALSQSSVFATVEQHFQLDPSNRLVGILEGSTRSKQILLGFVDRLRADSIESNRKDCGKLPNYVSFEPSEWNHSISHHIKLTILQILIWNLSTKMYPTIGHLMLGLHLKTELDSVSSDLTFSCLPAIADLLCGSSSNESILITQPMFAEQCFHLIFLLVSNPVTSVRVLRYLRNEHDFFLRQLHLYDPVKDNPDHENLDEKISRLYHGAWFLQSLAIELHITARSGQRSQSQRLLSLLFNVTSLNGIQPIGNVLYEEQSLEQAETKIIQILAAFNFLDTCSEPLNLSQTVFEDLNMAEFMTTDVRGTEIFDIQNLLDLMLSFLDTSDSSGLLIQFGGRAVVMEQIEAIIGHLREKNENQQLMSARFSCSKAWMDLVRIAVTQYFDLFPFDIRERRMFELLAYLLQHVNKPGVSLAIASCASQATLTLVSRLKEDRDAHTLVISPQGPNLQSDSFHSLILKGILDGIQIPGSSSIIRGNYYSALACFLSYILPGNLGQPNQTGSLTANNWSGLEVVSMIFRQPHRFWDLICKDASDAEHVWQSVSFSTLASLCAVANAISNRNSSHPIINFLTKRNYLGHYVDAILDSDSIYTRILQNDSASMNYLTVVSAHFENARFVFETKMVFLLRLAQCRSGAERLIDFGVLEVFARCKYLDQLPRTTYLEVSALGDLPLDKYYALTNPVYELVLALLSHFDTTHVLVLNKLRSFLEAHQGAIMGILNGSEVFHASALYQIKLITSIFGWMGVSNELAHRTFPGPGQNNFSTALMDLLKLFSNSSWHSKLSPVSDLDKARAEAIGPFAIAGSKRSVFLEDAIRTTEIICRNILIFFRKKLPSQNWQYDVSVLTQLISESVEKLNHLVLEEQSVRVKLNDSSQVSAEEINDIAKSFHRKIYHELTLSQRQELYSQKLRDVGSYIAEKSRVLLSICRFTLDILEAAGLELVFMAEFGQSNARTGHLSSILERFVSSTGV